MNEEILVRFETLAAGGACKGTPVDAAFGSVSVFAHDAAPGDLARVRIVASDKRFRQAELVELAQPSPDRVAPPCPVFADCGGCDWQHVRYERQCVEKAEIARYALRRAGVAPEAIRETVASPMPFGYRLRGDLAVRREGARVSIGFRRRRSHEIVEVAHCPQFDPRIGERFSDFARVLAGAGIGDGVILRVRVVLDEATGIVALLPNRTDDEREDPAEPIYLDASGARVAAPANFQCANGIAELQYAPSCFTQVNSGVNALLVRAVLEAMEPDADTNVLELFSGIGNFTIPVAARCREITAVESGRDAHEWARRNADRLGIANARFIHRPAASVVKRLAHMRRRFDRLLVDPPRLGLGPDLCRRLASFEARRIVYVSCGIESLARDLGLLAAAGYATRSVTPFDMFPQTRHMELLCVLDREG